MNVFCPICQSENTYPDRDLLVCIDCQHEWKAQSDPVPDLKVEDHGVRDANGTILVDGDAVIVLKELKIKGAASSIKSGTKVRNIRLVEPVDGHNIACKIEGIGSIHLKSEFVRKA